MNQAYSRIFMYMDFEKPIIRASLFYYDTNYDISTAYQVLEVLKKFGFYPAKKIYADKLTRGKYKKVNPSSEELFAKAYAEKDVFGVGLLDDDKNMPSDFWRFSWNFTFYKSSRLPVKNPVFMPWNVIFIDCVHSRLLDKKWHAEFIDCIKALILAIDPFYANIDDVANKVDLLDQTGEPHFAPDHIQQIYWGNYIGKDLCNKHNISLSDFPLKNAESFCNGILFFLSENALNYDSLQCRSERRIVQKYLKRQDRDQITRT